MLDVRIRDITPGCDLTARSYEVCLWKIDRTLCHMPSEQYFWMGHGALNSGTGWYYLVSAIVDRLNNWGPSRIRAQLADALKFTDLPEPVTDGVLPEIMGMLVRYSKLGYYERVKLMDVLRSFKPLIQAILGERDDASGFARLPKQRDGDGA